MNFAAFSELHTFTTNQGLYSKVDQMMQPAEEGGNPGQFRQKFRMCSEAFLCLRDALWQRVCEMPTCHACRATFIQNFFRGVT